jgi:hypothetical protein
MVVTAAASPQSGPRGIPVNNRSSLDSSQQQQVAMLRGLLADIHESKILHARIGGPPRSFAAGRGVWIYYDIRAPNDPSVVKGEWQASITSGLLRQISRSRGWPSVKGHSFTLVLPSGATRFDSANALGHPPSNITTISEKALEAILRASSQRVGLALTRIQYLRQHGHLAPEIVVEATDPRAFVRDKAKLIWAIVEPVNRGDGHPRAEGVYVDVRDSDGRWVVASGYSVRTGAGVSASNPNFGG